MLSDAVSAALDIIHSGLPPVQDQPPKKVIIVGAGMAGLVAAYELLRAGHDPHILEAQSRVGGRVYTLREPFAPGLHAEAGAMRIPRAHKLTLAYVEKFNLPVLPFTMGNPQAYCHLGGVRRRLAEVQANPELLDFDFSATERPKGVQCLWEEALAPLADQVQAGGSAAWEQIRAEYDQYSVREFLEFKGWSEGAIECFGLLNNQEAMMNSSFMELLREEIGGFYTDLVQIEGGMDRLPHAFLPELRSRIRFGAKMIAIDQSPQDVTIHIQSTGGRYRVSGDYAILTVPFPVLRHIEVLKPFSRSKQRAIRQTHYDASAKVFMQFRRRFWEQDDGIYGGGSVTDMAIRNVYYPDHGRQSGRGVVLASYTWSEDAQRWGSLAPDDRITQALENLAVLHPQAPHEFECGASKMWHDDEFAGGAFALFDPEQQSLLYDAIIAPEGRIYFAGEHASLEHAWIQGAIESGLRAATEIHSAAA
jgi:monoamine oxidase